MKFRCILLFLVFFPWVAFAQLGLQWENRLGGDEDDIGQDVLPLSNGDFLAIGFSSSYDGDVSTPLGDKDYWIVRTDPLGEIIWERTYGGSAIDLATQGIEGANGSFLIIGTSNSNDTDINNPLGGEDVWIINIDANGNLLWEKSFGGSDADRGVDVISTSDGGYLFTATTRSTNGQITTHNGASDVWVVKIDANGQIQWQKTFGGSSEDRTSTVQEVSDGYLIAATTFSNDGDISNLLGVGDFWLLKINLSGALIWEKTFGGSALDQVNDFKITSDGGMLLVGETLSTDGNVTGHQGAPDFWVLKLDTNGILQWQKTFGGTWIDTASSIDEIPGIGYWILGSTSSDDGDITELFGITDLWLLQLDFNGNLIWQKSLGEAETDNGYAVKTTLNGAVIAGTIKVENHRSPSPHGTVDFWLLHIGDTTSVAIEEVHIDSQLFPNPSSGIVQLEVKEPIKYVEIISTNGIKLYEAQPFQSKLFIDLKRWNSGIYFLKGETIYGHLFYEKIIRK